MSVGLKSQGMEISVVVWGIINNYKLIINTIMQVGIDVISRFVDH